MFSGLGSPGHLLILAVVALLALGPKRLPQLARSLGSGLRNVHEALTSDTQTDAPQPADQPLEWTPFDGRFDLPRLWWSRGFRVLRWIRHEDTRTTQEIYARVLRRHSALTSAPPSTS
jgi:sec-independent protein translocase protein TatA